jgi:hypothetical protein
MGDFAHLNIGKIWIKVSEILDTIYLDYLIC